MTDVSECDVYLVGSMAVPTDTVEEAMRIAADTLGDSLCGLPDGEVGQRSFWVAGLGPLTYSRHPDLEEVGESEGFHPVPSPFGPMGAHRMKSAAGELSLEGYLPYADAALESYPVFRALRDGGDLAPDVRFQVAVPTPLAAVAPFFGDSAEWPAAMAAFQPAIMADIARILEVVPADELAIQWDYCTEVCDIVGAASGRRELNGFMAWYPQLPPEEAFAAHTAAEYIGPLSDGIPDAVRLGYHFCLGTFPQFPTVLAEDLGWVVRIANAVVANTRHRVDFVHLPSKPEAGRDFFAPLADLNVDDARVFLGVGGRDGKDAIAARGRAAQEFLPDFGISHHCGYGRDDRDTVADLLRDLRAGAELLAR